MCSHVLLTRVRFQLITMFFGANDLCSGQCYDKEGTTPLQHSKKLQKALDYLQANLPRTMINLVPVLGGYSTVTFLYTRGLFEKFPRIGFFLIPEAHQQAIETYHPPTVFLLLVCEFFPDGVPTSGSCPGKLSLLALSRRRFNASIG